MKVFDMMKKAVADGVAAAQKHAPGIASGVASKALALGQAAASATATAASGAYDSLRDLAAEKFQGSHFSEQDVEQGAEMLKVLKVGVANPDGTFRLMTDEEYLNASRVVLVATLEEDDPNRKMEGDDA